MNKMVTEHSNPLAVLLPYTFNSQSDYPTEVLANRFQAWRSIIKDLVNYLKEYASVQEEIVRQQMRLQQAVGISSNSGSQAGGSSSQNHTHGHRPSGHHDDDISAINKYLLPIGNGSIQDLPTILTKFHQQNVANSSKTLKDINSIMVPKLEELRKDLLIKIKEIKNLQNDFKNSLGKEINETKQVLSQYNQAIELSNRLDHGSLPLLMHTDGDHSRLDPYLVKVKLDRQLKKQIAEESYLHDAYSNLQTAGGKLESIIVLEIQNYLSMFLNLLNTEHSTIPEFLLPNLNNGFLSKEPEFEWDSFISRNLPSPSISVSALGNNSSSVKNGTFIDLSFPSRKVSELVIPDGDSPLTMPIRQGTLERRSKFLKSYSSGWYVLTCNYLHEFKSSDRKKDMQPVMSLLLDAFQVSEHSKNDGKPGGAYKFVLYSKLQNGIIHRGHNWVFRTDTYQNMIDWYSDIKSLTSVSTPSARGRIVSKKFKLDQNPPKRLSRNSSIGSSNARSMRTVTTNNSSKFAAGSIRSKQKSPGASTRLSSTFSKTNNQSPKLTNMVNSDGTMITPVEGHRDGKTSPMIYQAPQHTTTQQIVSPANLQPGYYYTNASNGQQVQQFYDPVQKQYYTINPSTQPEPQPQYFPTSPYQGTQQPIFMTPTPGQSQGSLGQPQPQGPTFIQTNGTSYPVVLQQSINEKRNSTHLQAPASINSSRQPSETGTPFDPTPQSNADVYGNEIDTSQADSTIIVHQDDTTSQQDGGSKFNNEGVNGYDVNVSNGTHVTNEVESLQNNMQNTTLGDQ